MIYVIAIPVFLLLALLVWIAYGLYQSKHGGSQS